MIGVLIVWAVIIAVAYFLDGSTPGYPILLGMLSMYIAMRVYPPKRNDPNT